MFEKLLSFLRKKGEENKNWDWEKIKPPEQISAKDVPIETKTEQKKDWLKLFIREEENQQTLPISKTGDFFALFFLVFFIGNFFLFVHNVILIGL